MFSFFVSLCDCIQVTIRNPGFIPQQTNLNPPRNAQYPCQRVSQSN